MDEAQAQIKPEDGQSNIEDSTTLGVSSSTGELTETELTSDKDVVTDKEAMTDREADMDKDAVTDKEAMTDKEADMDKDAVTDKEAMTDKEEIPIPKVAKKETKKEKEIVSSKSSSGGKRIAGSSTLSDTKTPTSSSTARINGAIKTSSRHSIASNARKSIGNMSSSSLGHSKSIGSIGGSGDEKKKALLPGASRGALAASSVHHQPKRSETLAEKRGAPTTVSRKQTTPALTSTSQRSVTRPSVTTKPPTSLGNKSTTSSTARPSISGTVADAKKRLSAISGSAGLNKSSARTSTSLSKEIDDLRVKLADSEIKVEKLQNEIVAAQEKLLESSKKEEEERKKFTEKEEKIKLEYNELTAKFQNEISELQARLEEAQSAKVTAEKSLTEFEDKAKEIEATNIAAAIKAVKYENELNLNSVKRELLTAQENYESAKSSLKEKESKVNDLELKISHSEKQLKAIREEHQRTIADLEESLAQDHKAIISSLRTEHTEKVARLGAEFEKVHSEKTNNLIQSHQAEFSDLQTQLNDAVTSLAEERANHEKTTLKHSQQLSEALLSLNAEISELKQEAEGNKSKLHQSSEELKNLTAKYDSALKETQTVKNDLDDANEKLRNLNALRSADLQELSLQQDESTQLRGELSELKKMMRTYDADEKNKNEALAKIKSEHENTTKKLVDKNNEVIQLKKKHEAEIQTVSEEYEQKLDCIRKISPTKNEYDDLMKKLDDAQKAHSIEINQINQDHKSSLSSLEEQRDTYEKEINDMKVVHEKNIRESCKKAIDHLNDIHSSEICDILSKNQELVDGLNEKLAEFQRNEALNSANAEAIDKALQSDSTEAKKALPTTYREPEPTRTMIEANRTEKASAELEVKSFLRKNIQKQSEEFQTDEIKPKITEDQADQKALEFMALPPNLGNSKCDVGGPNELAGTKGEQEISSPALSTIGRARTTAKFVSDLNDVLDSENSRCIQIITDPIPLQLTPYANYLNPAE
ncbi:BgTH12-03886 [Blumeria graminis f. sp. triticale]|uniref:BgTH12-03886 n=1 Tax=Blumeria graminis f. sp. triticale TaxID=1689686 RepID=A0A9W4GBQ8_BLUGR|nr:BgTH12-03886 [Blumeria graminis f. sp. triticale]